VFFYYCNIIQCFYSRCQSTNHERFLLLCRNGMWSSATPPIRRVPWKYRLDCRCCSVLLGSRRPSFARRISVKQRTIHSSFTEPTHGGMARLSWPGWRFTYQDDQKFNRGFNHGGA